MACGKIYKTNLFKDIRYPVGMVHEDDATTPELFYKSKTVILTNDILYFYRQREGSITNKLFTAARFDGVKAVERCIAFFEQQNDRELSELARINRLVVQSKIVIRAYGDHAQKAVPKEYAMPERKALRNIRKWTSDDTYTWYLSLVHPKWDQVPFVYTKNSQLAEAKRQETANMTHGFITIATGDEQYYRMAVNLLRSYRYFTGSALPFAVLADRENEYTAEFDDVRLFPEARRNYLDKLGMFDLLPV